MNEGRCKDSTNAKKCAEFDAYNDPSLSCEPIQKNWQE